MLVKLRNKHDTRGIHNVYRLYNLIACLHIQLSLWPFVYIFSYVCKLFFICSLKTSVYLVCLIKVHMSSKLSLGGLVMFALRICVYTYVYSMYTYVYSMYTYVYSMYTVCIQVFTCWMNVFVWRYLQYGNTVRYDRWYGTVRYGIYTIFIPLVYYLMFANFDGT